MKLFELSIGNLIIYYFDDKPGYGYVDQIYNSHIVIKGCNGTSILAIPLENIDGIEVTKQILEKNEFKANIDRIANTIYGIEDTNIQKCLYSFEREFDNYIININQIVNSYNKYSINIETKNHMNVGSMEFTYLHELQNIINLITKNNFEFKI